MRCRKRRVAGPTVLAAVVLALPALSQADDGELRLLTEPTAFVDVPDAADGDDRFDFDVRIALVHTLATGDLSRQAPGAGGTSAYEQIGVYRQAQNTLDLGVRVGLFRDLAVRVGLPVILSDERRIALPSGVSAADVTDRLRAPRDGTSAPLWDGRSSGTPVPFDSPTRSGLDRLELGLLWGVTNQNRSAHLPTWVLRIDSGVAVGPVMRPCNGSDPSACDPGSSRGVHSMRVDTRVARRVGVAEPYAGLAAEVAWPSRRAEKRFAPSGGLPGYRHVRPPTEGEVVFGVALVPWENRERFQRFTVDLRLQGAYVSAGHDYTPLFDALGSSTNPYLAMPTCEGVPEAGDPPCGDPGSSLSTVEFTGLTDVAAHGRLGGAVRVELWAARYVRFDLGAGLTYVTGHLLTATERCNTQVAASGRDPSLAAGCPEVILDPHYRSAIDTPGTRFYLDRAFTWDLGAAATAQF